jgi:hypothetical protein
VRSTHVAAVGLLCATLVATIAARQQAPARDAAAQPTSGTASISGIVINDEGPPQPVRRAIVTLTGEGLRPNRGAITDDDGRFRIDRLPAGAFTLTVTRPSFVTSAYGAKRPGRTGTPIAVTEGAHVGNLVVKIWRGAVIAGVVRDEHGAPVSGLPVTATPARASTSALLTLSNNGVETNDLGEYRIFGLEPGRYFVSVKPTSGGGGPLTALTDAEVDAAFTALKQRAPLSSRPAGPIAATSSRPFDYAPVFHPAETNLARAQPIALAAGEEALGIDITLRRVATSTIRGSLTRADGLAASGTSLQLKQIVPPGPFALDAPTINATARPDGAFQLSQVLPGDYRLIARAPMKPPPPNDPRGGTVTPPSGMGSLWAVTDITVSGSDIDGLALSLEPGVTIRGRLVFDAHTLAPPKDLSQFRVFLSLPQMLLLRPGQGLSGSSFLQMSSQVSVRPDGTFEIPNVLPDTFKFVISGAGIGPRGWLPVSAIAAGRDWLEGLVTLTRSNVEDLVVTLTDRHTELSGRLSSSDGAPVSDVFVLAFSATRSHWGLGSRRVQAVRPSVDGRYSIPDLPPGQYFVSALTDVDPDEWLDPAFLEKLVGSTVTVTIGDGERKVQDLRLGVSR